MLPPFEPLFRNPHLATFAGHYWRRSISSPALRKVYPVDSRNTVVAYESRPPGAAHGQIVCLHGLEGSSDAGYLASFTEAALEHGFGVHRLNMRTCGGTENLCETMYHSGLTSDPLFVLRQLEDRGPLFLLGFSLGGNVALKLAGELGVSDLLAGVIAVSTPIDLAASVRAIDKPVNYFYARRFLDRLRGRVRRKSATQPELYDAAHLDSVHSIWEFDDRYTAPLFGFGTAANYYRTQSAVNFIPDIAIPTLLIAAQDDPLVPFRMYKDPRVTQNPNITLWAPEHGGHLGFISRRRPRFWLDQAVLSWIEQIPSLSEQQAAGTKLAGFASQ